MFRAVCYFRARRCKQQRRRWLRSDEGCVPICRDAQGRLVNPLHRMQQSQVDRHRVFFQRPRPGADDLAIDDDNRTENAVAQIVATRFNRSE